MSLRRAPRSLFSLAARLGAVPLLLLLARPMNARPAAEPGLDVVSSHLRAARVLAQQRIPLARLATMDPLLRLRDGLPEIELRFGALTPDTVGAIAALGALIDHVSYRYARVLVHADPALLPGLAALPGVTAIHPNYGAQHSAGAVPGQGDTGLRADVARTRFGVDGTGVRVGILSDSFSQIIGGSLTGNGCARRLNGSSAQFSADLPADVVVLNDGPPNSEDEGAAMGEIVHDIAPGATLLFATANLDEATFAEDIDALVACGVDVLVDDVLYFDEPMFQDGIVAQAAQAAVDNGTPFFSAVGNQARAGIEQAYQDAVPDRDDEAQVPTGDDFHDFGGGDRFAAITIPTGCDILLVLQWDEPFSGTLGPGASTDLDLYIFGDASPDATVLGSGTDSQGCSAGDTGPRGDPLEMASYLNLTNMPRTVYAAVDNFCGRKDVRFRIATLSSKCGISSGYAFEPTVFTGPQIYGHAAAAGVAGIAAVFFQEIESDGAVTGPAGVINVEPFSALGGALSFAFGPDGQPLPGGPAQRFKPDLAAPDGVNTTFFGSTGVNDGDSFPNFFGTSAAAPHAAGVAALVRQAAPGISPAALLDALRHTAADIETPGLDALSGDGLIDADAVLQVLLAPTPTATPSAPPTATPTGTRPGDCGHDGLVSIGELVTAVRIALGEAQLSECLAADANGDGHVGIDDLVGAVAAALQA